METTSQKTVFVGLSGGVDSSVAALRLIQQGYNVVGVFIKVWHPDFLECNWEQERLDAMRVAAKLDIPFLTCDAEKAYKDDVADYFIGEYKSGRTPNPDVMCNKYVKFGAFFDFAMERGAHYIATGHYAQRNEAGDGFELVRGIDTNKDQTYFLWTLTQTQLTKVLLPVGDSEKKVIRQEAQDAGLLTAEKRDSQGICFLGHVDIPEFLSHYIELKEGDVLDEEGNSIGTHKGALVYTTGQRHGFTTSLINTAHKPLYVVGRDIVANTISVSATKAPQEKQSTLRLDSCNFINWQPTAGDTIEVQTRYRQKPSQCKIISYKAEALELSYIDEAETHSSGQSCVLYKGEKCCGGVIIL
jgi:tRNA-specific 2-thiouridylase